MKNLILVIFVVGVWGTPAVAADLPVQNAPLSAAPLPVAPLSAKRQMVGCMNKHMSASRTVSYNDAKKACTAQLKPTSDTAPHALTAAR